MQVIPVSQKLILEIALNVVFQTAFLKLMVCVMSQKRDIPNMVISGTQLRPFPVQIFCWAE